MASRLSILFLNRPSRRSLAGWLLAAVITPASASMLSGQLLDQNGDPVGDAVITLSFVGPAPTHVQPTPSPALIDQRGREFIPHVLAIRRDTAVRFPNSDRIHHHVYSFSPAKRFEIKLYKGTPAEPIRFDQVGIVVLGCNIHDWMIAYIHVTDAPYFTVTDSHGQWTVDVPPADYRLAVWHPDLDSATDALPSQALTVGPDPSPPLLQRLRRKPNRRNGKPPASLQEESYRGEP